MRHDNFNWIKSNLEKYDVIKDSIKHKSDNTKLNITKQKISKIRHSIIKLVISKNKHGSKTGYI